MTSNDTGTGPEQDATPYTNDELFRMATDRRGPQALSAVRVLATYANPENWKSVIAKDEAGKMRSYWSWCGPTIVGYELAGHGLRDANGGDA